VPIFDVGRAHRVEGDHDAGAYVGLAGETSRHSPARKRTGTSRSLSGVRRGNFIRWQRATGTDQLLCRPSRKEGCRSPIGYQFLCGEEPHCGSVFAAFPVLIGAASRSAFQFTPGCMPLGPDQKNQGYPTSPPRNGRLMPAAEPQRRSKK
jgi:hypothetical protein